VSELLVAAIASLSPQNFAMSEFHRFEHERERKLNSEKFKKDKSIDLKVGHPLYKFF
jgi:hypothetical protein